MPPTLYGGFFCMIVWKSREEVNTAWESPTNQIITAWKDRPPVNNEWGDSWRDKHKTKSRKYMLWSFFATVLTAITDTKDGKAIKIKCDPAYLHDSEFNNREEATTQWRVRFRS